MTFTEGAAGAAKDTSPDALRAATFVDLQVHTTASDGVLPPRRVVEAAVAARLHAIAITDHDTVDGLPEAEAAGAELGVRIVPGVELAVHFEGEELHILGLHLGRREAMADALAAFRNERVDRAVAIIEVLNRRGIPVTLESVLAHANGGAVGRPHIARAMMAGGWVRDFRDAFDKWLGWGKPAFVAKGALTLEESVALIHRAGGLAVWAHPADLATEPRLTRLAEVGLDAVEVLHPSHTQALAETLFDRAERVGLLPSGGSDWHGSLEGPRQLGRQLVPRVWLERQDAAVEARSTT